MADLTTSVTWAAVAGTLLRGRDISHAGCERICRSLPLRANIAETLLAPLITEQGEKDIQHEEYEEDYRRPARCA